jgi:hypothetical protein
MKFMNHKEAFLKAELAADRYRVKTNKWDRWLLTASALDNALDTANERRFAVGSDEYWECAVNSLISLLSDGHDTQSKRATGSFSGSMGLALEGFEMKQLFTLEGDYEGKQVRRLKKFGRIELLRVFHDSDEIIQEPYWFVRITGFKENRDRDRATRCSNGRCWGNGYWRFCHLELAQAKFDELAAQPESVAEAAHAEKLRDQKREAFQARVRDGKLRLFQKTPQSEPTSEADGQSER